MTKDEMGGLPTLLESARSLKSPAWVKLHPEEVLAEHHDLADALEALKDEIERLKTGYDDLVLRTSRVDKRMEDEIGRLRERLRKYEGMPAQLASYPKERGE